jgi:hypothetical protein
MKNLPIGIQTLSKLREENYIYVDKTQLVHQLVTTGFVYFLSRPRRFGKSLLVSTLKELYKGNRPIFEGLWIENQWDWSQSNPVLHFSFDAMSYIQLGLENALNKTMNEKASDFGIELSSTDFKSKFSELIKVLSEKHGKVVLLVDEYDKPIIDFLENSKIEQGKAHRDILREFYSVLKSSEENLKFVFITGISKFSKVSLFSHLNNLDDITLSPKYSTITGYTQKELEENFNDYLISAENKFQITREALLQQMKIWYNGYSWDGVNRVYNPFGTLNFLSNQVFRNFWFTTGSPMFLIEQMREKVVYDVENTIADSIEFETYDIDNISLIPLLFQTGYLTIKELDIMTGDMILDYPNKEVRESMYHFLINDLSRNPRRTATGRTIQDINKALQSRDLERVREIINSILADLPSETFIKQTEGLYHGLVHVIFSYLGVFVSSEVHSSIGRADAVVETANDVFIFEFKFNKTAKEAIEQIKKKNYAGKYKLSNKKILGVGVNFNNDEKQIDDWLEVEL